MPSRYSDVKILENKSDVYKNFFSDRNVNFISQYETQALNYPTQQQINQLQLVEYVWAQHDRYWRLAETYYGDPKYWWVISFFNKKPTEAEINIGDLIYIPMPLERIVFYIKG